MESILKRPSVLKEQLGMPHGTATNRLRRIVTWQLLVKTNQTLCFRCAMPMDAETYSLDHIEPWLDGSIDLFWDLDNITWSHKGCNSKAGRRDTERSKVAANLRGKARIKSGPEGTAWCTKCQELIDTEFFTKNASRWNGLSAQCRACRSDTRSTASRHGTESMYNSKLCKCESCTKAAREGRLSRLQQGNKT